MSWSLAMVSRSLAIMGRREMGRKLTGSVVYPPLYSSMSLVYLSASAWVLCFFDGFVVERGKDRGEEVAEVSDDSWGNVVDVSCLVGVAIFCTCKSLLLLR